MNIWGMILELCIWSEKNKLLKIDGVTVLLGWFGIKIVGTLLIQASGEYVNSIQTSHDGQGR